MISAKEGRKHDTAAVVRSKIFLPATDGHDFPHVCGERVCPQAPKTHGSAIRVRPRLKSFRFYFFGRRLVLFRGQAPS